MQGEVLNYFRRAMSVSTTITPKLSGTESVIVMLEGRKTSTEVLSSANVSVRDALRTQDDEAKRVMLKELKQMVDRNEFRPVHRTTLTEPERKSTIRSSMFLKAKYHPDGTFDKLKARLVAGGDQQDKAFYSDLSTATVLTSAVFTLAAVAAHERRHVSVVENMRLDKTTTRFITTTLDPSYNAFVDDRGRVTVKLKKALYGCVESSGLW
jgi:hypothetical protein